MNGKFSRQPFLSSVAKISCRLRTSIQSPTPKFSTPCRIELGVFMLTCLRGVDNSRADFKMLHEVWQTRWSHNVAFRASDRSPFPHHARSESPAVWGLVNSGLVANSQGNSFGVLSRRPLCGHLSLYSRRRASLSCFASLSVVNQCASRHSARSAPLNDSTGALSVGFPGREKSVRTPTC